jgi:hypothetical protein
MASPCRKAFFATFALPAADLGPVLRRAFRRFELARAARITVRPARKWTNKHALLKLRLQLTHSLGRTALVPFDFMQSSVSSLFSAKDHQVDPLDHVELVGQDLRENGFAVESGFF